jgi:PKD repeat protein
VLLLVGNDCGEDSILLSVEVFFAPRAMFSADQTSGCGEEMVVQFTNLTEGEVTSIQWFFPGGNPDESTDLNPVVTYSTPGVFDVMLIASGPGGRDTMLLRDYIEFADALPTAGFDFEAVDLLVTFSDKTTRGTSYLWDFGDGETSTEKEPVHLYGASGTYFVTQIVTNACGADTLVQEVSIINSSTDLPRFLQDVLVFPNPNTGVFVLELTGLPVGVVDLEVVDVLGRAVFQHRLDMSHGHFRQEIALPAASAGSYFLRLHHKGEFYTQLIHVTR